MFWEESLNESLISLFLTLKESRLVTAEAIWFSGRGRKIRYFLSNPYSRYEHACRCPLVKSLYCLINILTNLANLFMRRSGECSLLTISWLSEGRKLRLLTIRSVMMSLRDWSWLSQEDTSSSLLKKAATLFCLEALSRSLVNVCSSLSLCEQHVSQNFRPSMMLYMGLALSMISPLEISLPRQFGQSRLRDTRRSPFALSAAYMPCLL